MRVLHLVHHYPPELYGGTQSYVAALSRLQAAQGHSVTVLAGAAAGRPGGGLERDADGEVAVLRLLRDLPAQALSGQLGDAAVGERVSALLRELEPDVCHVHHWSTLSDDLVRRAKAEGLPTVLTLHDLYATCARYFRMPDARHFCDEDVGFADCARCLEPDAGGASAAELEPVVERRFASFQAELAAADRVLAMSGAQKALLGSLPGFDAERLEVAPIGLRRTTLSPAPWTPAPERLRIVNWAGLDPRKGIHVLVEAVATSEDRDRLELHLYGREGDEPYMRELRELAAGAPVTFHGPFDDAERPELGRYDVAAFPFLAFETHGLAVDEALALGLPVIVPDHGAPVERLHGKGFAVHGNDVAALRSALEWLLDQPEEVARMRALPARLASLEEHAEGLEALYRELASA